MIDQRHQREIEHGKLLASKGAESIWGWDSPAGKVRAQRRATLILSKLPEASHASALEIGCGTGDFTRIFATTINRLTAVDISEELLTIARKNLSDMVNVEFILSSFEAIPCTDLYDAVIGSSVLHHLEIMPALSQIYRLLKPGGVISFAEPNMLNPQIMVQKNIPWIKKRMGDSPDETAFFRWQISRRLEEVGFVEIHVTPFDWLHPLIPQPLIKAVSLFGKFLERTPLFNEFAGSLMISAKKGLTQ